MLRAVPFIDPIDVRYNRFTRVVVPRAKAVMFCLMDVSASMGEREKDLAKRFFILLHLFLKRKYERVDVVFIRHTHEAKEVDEHEFFYGRETGGTVVSSALEEMIEIRDKRYSPAEWNIYCAEASDGDNSGGDTEHCVELLTEAILPTTQYFAYIEIADRDISSHWSGGDSKELWRGYADLAEAERRISPCARSPTPPTSIPCSVNCSRANVRRGRHERDRAPAPRRSAAVRRRGMGFRADAARSTRRCRTSRSTISASTCFPTRSR